MPDPSVVFEPLPNAEEMTLRLKPSDSVVTDIPDASPTTTKFLCDDGTWQTPPGSGGGGQTKSEEFLVDDTWEVPAGVSMITVDMIGGGASGESLATGSTGGTGGGGGELCEGMAVPCTPGATITINIGAGGAAANAANCNPGGDTSIISDGVTYYARGALSIFGGGVGGSGTTDYPTQESNTYFGGAAGGIGGTGTGGIAGGANASYPTGASGGVNTGGLGGGGGGATTPFGVGGVGGAGDAVGNDAPAGSYGAGGGGSGAKTSGAHDSGAGMSGRVLICWIG